MLSWCCCGSLVAFPFSVFCLCPPPLSITCSFSVCVCGRGSSCSTVAHLRRTNSSSTAFIKLVSPPLDRCIRSVDVTVPLLNVFCVFAFVLMPFSLLWRQSALRSAHLFTWLPPRRLHSPVLACLPAYLLPPSSHPHHPPAQFVK